VPHTVTTTILLNAVLAMATAEPHNPEATNELTLYHFREAKPQPAHTHCTAYSTAASNQHIISITTQASAAPPRPTVFTAAAILTAHRQHNHQNITTSSVLTSLFDLPSSLLLLLPKLDSYDAIAAKLIVRSDPDKRKLIPHEVHR